VLTPALYRTRITHLRRGPVRHSFTHRGYSWYVDVDNLPRLPWWLGPLARFEARDHLGGTADQSFRDRVNAFFARNGLDPDGGPITALLQARVFGYVFNPLTVFWCHDRHGVLRHVVAEVHNTYGERHAYLLPVTEQRPARVTKTFYVSPFNQIDGYYLVRAPMPDEHVDVTISLHRSHQPAFVARMRGTRRPATAGQLLGLQLVAPFAPLIGALAIRFHGILLWLRRVPVVPRNTKVSQS
jgi:uncharacterized protein